MNSSLIEPGTVRLERLLPGPAERVWAYLTESKKRATWFAGGEFDLRAGGRGKLEFNHANLSADKVTPEKYRSKSGAPSSFDCTITRVEPNRLLTFSWTMGSGAESADTETTFELTPRGAQVLLVIVHRRLGTRGRTVNVMSGWDVHTGILEDVLNGVEPRRFWATHARLEKEYDAMVPA